MPRVIRGSLLEVLAGRGELAAARAIREAGGWRGISSSLVSQMFPDLGAGDISHIFRLAIEGMEAAGALNRAAAGSTVDPLLLPVNFQLFAGTPSAARGLLTLEVSPPDGGVARSISIYTDIVGGESIDQLRQMGRDVLADRVKRSPEGFGLTQGEANNLIDDLAGGGGDVLFTFAEARL